VLAVTAYLLFLATLLMQISLLLVCKLIPGVFTFSIIAASFILGCKKAFSVNFANSSLVYSCNGNKLEEVHAFSWL
jgi:hypothetical protein